MFFKKKDLVYAVSFLLIVAFSVIYKIFMAGSLPFDDAVELIRTSETSGSSEVTEPALENIKIYICGEVSEPGVYEVPSGSILYDVVLLAGGLTDKAAKNDVDLVMILDKNVSICIPSEDEVRSGAVTVAEDDGLININKAGKEELKSLPGIGDAMADAIIKYREESVFEKKEDIMNVSGIGESKYNRIKDMITVG